jgi:hypothetical protein
MPDFSNRSPGDKSPAKSADWCNAVSKAAQFYHDQVAGGAAKAARPAKPISFAEVKIKNTTGSNLLRGHYVQLGEAELAAKDPKKIWFEGNLYSESETRRIAIVNDAVKQDKRVDAMLIGKTIAVVDVGDTDHRYAVPVDGEYVFESAESGPVEILDILAETGVQEAAVIIGAGGGGEVGLKGAWGWLNVNLAAHTNLSLSAPTMGEFNKTMLEIGATGGSSTEGVYVLDFKKSGDDYIFPPTILVPHPDYFDDDAIPHPLVAVNAQPQRIEASDAKPVIVHGYIVDFPQPEGEAYSEWELKRFVVENIFDHSMLPGFVIGEDSTGDDDPGLQAVVHEGGTREHILQTPGPCLDPLEEGDD